MNQDISHLTVFLIVVAAAFVWYRSIERSGDGPVTNFDFALLALTTITLILINSTLAIFLGTFWIWLVVTVAVIGVVSVIVFKASR